MKTSEWKAQLGTPRHLFLTLGFNNKQKNTLYSDTIMLQKIGFQPGINKQIRDRSRGSMDRLR